MYVSFNLAISIPEIYLDETSSQIRDNEGTKLSPYLY